MTRAVMEAALSAGVSRVVYTSSVATLLPIDGGVSDETHPATRNRPPASTSRARSPPKGWWRRWYARPARRDRQSIHPHRPARCAPHPTGRVVVEAANGKMPAYVDRA
jgi:hypothetical protein